MGLCNIKNRSLQKFRSDEAPFIAINEQFHDISSFSSVVDWELDFRQLDKGQLTADLTGILGRDYMLLGLDLNRSFHQLGAPPRGMFSFAVPFLETPEFRWCSGTTQGGSLLSFNLENNFDAISPAYAAVVVSINADLLQSLADESGLCGPLEDIFKSGNNWRSERSISLARELQKLMTDVRAGAVPFRAYSEFLNDDLPRAILAILMDGTPDSPGIRNEYRHRVFRRALEFINDSEHLPVKVSEVCNEVKCSPATLRRVFISEIGIPPKTYIKIRYLSAVRDALHQAEDGQSISDLANQWGFWHMGQFAKDYRLMFAELPSDTHNSSG